MKKSIRIKSMPMKQKVQIKSIRMKKVYEWKKAYEWKTENNIEWKTPFKCFLTKRKGKCTQPNNKVVPSDSKCTWSIVNLG